MQALPLVKLVPHLQALARAFCQLIEVFRGKICPIRPLDRMRIGIGNRSPEKVRIFEPAKKRPIKLAFEVHYGRKTIRKENLQLIVRNVPNRFCRFHNYSSGAIFLSSPSALIAAQFARSSC